MEKIIEFVKSLFSPKALLGFIIGITIGFITTKIISITPGNNIHIGELFAALLVGMYFWLYCLQVNIKLATHLKFIIGIVLVALLSIDSVALIRQPILLFVGGGQPKNYPPFDTLSYMISYGIICVFIGGLIEIIWGVKNEENPK
ncbi:MAG: hypothetical protein CLLPBCKN_008468 [Chroococcidiopsis cubana SAG 39.79]|jgi:hypothetical protein|uniref:Uncharacterized protein n=1 Tax=Chroococcidiopsis cubana SAG 39.79 TaxID=388085 RepID=A0AB37UGK5_9CYAN|nr:hypothetical protein [Chroococcidiopsis cubana]MBE9019172.1 hypothetical protein [Chroococcidiopsidales cyanobacterium LEGE 13417]MDZ4879030.1 hypothetical protein [Chroococcidiopsis cubana SAG 39.79]PSB64082.1 hypothetical protein C7B79_11180 [Chroococcidiopsis cubana CCALA 043]RUT10720.1 hypothetical protein DSM107010_39600 [Chroococcidiopsis cubana SAG 39.79]